jgi:type VI secretion system protein VasJ
MDERLINLGKQPIDGDAPAGREAKYDDDYEQLMSEVAKLEAVSSDNPINWETINSLATGILESKSKDLLISCYLAHGLYLKQGMQGLDAGLNIINDMLESHFENMFPAVKRAKARANALTWLADKTEPYISALDPKVKEFEVFESCLSHINNIQSFCDEKMPDNSPSLGSFKRAVKNWRDHLKTENDKLQKAAAPKTEAEPASTQPSPAPSSHVAAIPQSSPAMGTVPAVGDLGSDQDVKSAIKSVQDVARKVAQYKRQKNLADPAAYSLLRTAIWMQIERLPPSEDGVTQLPEIDQDRQSHLQNLLSSGAHAELVVAAENAFCDAMFWLNSHRFVASALEALGHEVAKQTLVQSVVAFVNCFPGILELKFVNGNPFADDMTKLWIAEQQGGGGAGKSASAGSAPWESATGKALSLAAKGKLEEGLSILTKGLCSAADEREKFMWQLSVAQVLEKTGKTKLAVAHLEHLWHKLLKGHLTEWELEPSLVIAKSLSACYVHKNFVKEMTEERTLRGAELRSFIYRLDIQAALLLEPK